MKFNLPAPSSVEWYRSGVPGGGQRDHIFNRLKAKLIGGKDDSGTSYFKMHDRKLSNSDADKIIANMKQDEDGYPSFSTGSTSGEAEREYQEWIIDRYLVDATPTAKPPEDIPVEVEVVEVEQKAVDEPIVVKIEAPFEPEPQKKLEAPKRIRLPRRSGVMKARPIGPPKKSVASRMADAFDKRLDDLVDAVQNPPAPAPPKQRKQKESLYKIKKKVKPAKFKSNYKEKGNVKPFENLGKFTFNKVKSALGRAADARRMAQEQGLPEQEKGFYAFKALGFELGGDRIARTRGTFSKSPDATLDPSLSKQQRYTEGLFGTRSIRSKSAVGTRSKGGDGGVKQLDASFNKLTKQFDKVINLKKQNPSSSKDTAEFNKVVEELKEALQKGNKYQKEINAAKRQQAKIAADAANDAEAAAEEESLEQTRDSAGLSEIVKKQKKEKKKEKRDGGFNPFDFLKRFKSLRKLWRRIRNPVKTFKAVKRLVGQKVKKALRPVKELTENVAKKGKKFVDGATELGKRLKGGAIETAGKATDAVKGGIGRIGGWLSRAGDAIKSGAKRAWDATTSIGGWIGKKARAAGDLIASAPGKIGNQLKKLGVPKNWDELAKLARSDIGQKGIMLAMGPFGKYVVDQLTNPKSALKIAQRGIMNKKVQMAIIRRGGKELLEKVLAKLTVKVGGQAVPAFGQAINLGYGIIEAIVRGVMGDLKGSALSLGGAIPWVGAGFSIVDIIRDIDIEAYTKHIEPNLGSIAMGDGSSLVGFFNEVAGTDITTTLESDPPDGSKGGEEEPTNPGETKPEEKLSAGGIVPAMVGEAGPELVMGPGGGGFNPLQSLAPMIVAMREVTKRAGTWADPIENMVRQVTDPIAKQLKLPVLPTAVEIGKGVGSEVSGKKGKKRKKKGLGGGLASLLDDIGKLLNGGSDEKGTPGTANGSDAGGFKELLDMIAGVESTSAGGYNAFNTGGSDGGHTAHGSGDSSTVPIDGVVKPLTQRTVGEVMRLQAAGKLHATGRYQIIQKTLKGLMDGALGDTGVSENDLYDPVTQDKLGIALIKGRLATGADVENFRNEWIGLHHVDDAKLQAAIDRANAFNQSNPNFRPSATQGVPPNPGGAMPMTAKTKVVGDSIADGFAGAAGRSQSLATVGDDPSKVLNTLKSNVNSSNTSNVVLSTGLSNNTSMKAQAEQQMRYLQSQGIAFTVLPVSNAISAANGNLNQWLADKARQYGGNFASGAQFNHRTGDATRAHPEDYLPMVRAVTLGRH